MCNATIVSQLRRAASRFGGATQGNLAVIFAIALVPLISFVGAAIDYSRANAAKSSMQSALDSTSLMLSKDLSSGTITPAQINATAQAYFSALYNNKDAQDVSITASYTATSSTLGSSIMVAGTGMIVTDFMRVVGFPTMSFSTTSTTAWGNVRMRVAMALDNTGSMSADGKIGALRTAASNLVDQLSALSKTPGDVYISIIPFAKVVNVGISNSSQSWIDWTDWQNPPTSQPNNGNVGNTQTAFPPNWHVIGPGVTCPFTTSSGGFTCTTSPVNGSQGTAKIPSNGTYSGYICPSVDANSHTLYNGCWDSEPTGRTEVYCTGSSSCSCPNGTPSSCSCTGSGSSKSCTGATFIHNWTQPGVTVPVGYTNEKWTPTATPTVANVWTAASTNPTSTWTGCVTDRTQPYDAQNDTPAIGNTATLFPANQYLENSVAYCSSTSATPLQPLVPLSSNWATLKTTINAMQPTGGTDQAVGMAWAWESLLTTAPLNAPVEDPNYTYNRVIILLSDGLNTEDRWPANGNGSTQNVNAQNKGLIDLRQAALCQNIKNPIDPKTNQPMYTIYTIQVNTSVPADPTSGVLQGCASSPDKFFMLTSSSQIVTTFTTIGTQLSQLRVAR